MPATTINPYLILNGNAENAIQVYKQALGAKVENVMHFGDVQKDLSETDKKRVMHALLHIGQGNLMLSDSEPGKPVPEGANVQVTVDFDNVQDMTQSFQTLSEKGQVEMAIQDTFWGAKFGMLTDEFGVHWMFNCQKKS